MSDPTDQLITKSIMSSSSCVEGRENFKLYQAGGTNFNCIPLDYWREEREDTLSSHRKGVPNRLKWRTRVDPGNTEVVFTVAFVWKLLQRSDPWSSWNHWSGVCFNQTLHKVWRLCGLNAALQVLRFRFGESGKKVVMVCRWWKALSIYWTKVS